MDADRPLDRRSLLLMGAGLLVTTVACSSTADVPPGTTSRQPPSTARSSAPSIGSTTAPVTTAPGRLPEIAPWRPDAGDLDPAVKQEAAQVVEAIGSWRSHGGTTVGAARRLTALGQASRLATSARPHLDGHEASVIEVVEAQYGGLLSSSASVLVVCRQWFADATGSVVEGGTTVDVRLSRDGPHWRLTALYPGRPGAASAPIPRLAGQVLAERRIALPPAARADIASGLVHDSVLTAMLTLSRTYRIGVSVVKSGHPTYVFGTDTLSDHPMGRAFDTFRIDGHLVVDPETPEALVTGFMEAAALAGSYNVGGPYLLAGSGNRFFSNDTHHDHVHAGFTT